MVWVGEKSSTENVSLGFAIRSEFHVSGTKSHFFCFDFPEDFSASGTEISIKNSDQQQEIQ